METIRLHHSLCQFRGPLNTNSVMDGFLACVRWVRVVARGLELSRICVQIVLAHSAELQYALTRTIACVGTAAAGKGHHEASSAATNH